MAGRRKPGAPGDDAGPRRRGGGCAPGFLSGRTSPTPESHRAVAGPRREDVGLRQDRHFAPGPGGGRKREACPVAVVWERGPAGRSTGGTGLSRMARGHDTPRYDGPPAPRPPKAVIGSPAFLHAGFSVLQGTANVRGESDVDPHVRNLAPSPAQLTRNPAHQPCSGPRAAARRVGTSEHAFVPGPRRLRTLEYPLGTTGPVRLRLGACLRRDEPPLRRIQLPGPSGRPAGAAWGRAGLQVSSDLARRPLARRTGTFAPFVSRLPDARHLALQRGPEPGLRRRGEEGLGLVRAADRKRLERAYAPVVEGAVWAARSVARTDRAASRVVGPWCRSVISGGPLGGSAIGAGAISQAFRRVSRP